MTVGAIGVDLSALVTAGWTLAGVAAQVTASGQTLEAAADAAGRAVLDEGVAAALGLYLTTAHQAHTQISGVLSGLAQRATAAAAAYGETDRSIARATGRI